MDLLSELQHAFSEKYTGTLYHYTSAYGVAGIISNHEIWMSNTAFLNDTTELRMLQNAQSILKDDDFTNEYVKREWRRIQGQRSLQTNYYMASFSRAENQLEQWRAYGGFCIGFDAKELQREKGISLFRCLYRTNDIRRWILKREEKQVLQDRSDVPLYNEILAFGLIHIASIKYKNANFKSEKEVRLITTSDHTWAFPDNPDIYEENLPIHFRRHPVYGFPVPYVKFFIEQDGKSSAINPKEQEMEMKARKLREEGSKRRKLLPITEVMIGPMAHQKEAKTACEILLAERGYKNVEVNISSIPYRGL